MNAGVLATQDMDQASARAYAFMVVRTLRTDIARLQKAAALLRILDPAQAVLMDAHAEQLRSTHASLMAFAGGKPLPEAM